MTNSEYTPRCSKIGIKCINGKELDAWEDRLISNMKRKKQMKILASLLSILVIVCGIIYEMKIVQPMKNDKKKERERENERRRVYIYNYKHFI